MALTDLLRTLEEDAARELDRMQTEQRHVADGVRAAADEQAAATIAQATEEARAEAHRNRQLILAEARAAARASADQALHHELDALLAAARSELDGLAGTDRGQRATELLLTEALALLPTATQVRIDPRHRSAADTRDLEVVEERVGIGVAVEDDDGRAVDNTAAVRLANLWPTERAATAARWRADSDQAGVDPAGHGRSR